MRPLGCSDILPAAGPDELKIRVCCETPNGGRPMVHIEGCRVSGSYERDKHLTQASGN